VYFADVQSPAFVSWALSCLLASPYWRALSYALGFYSSAC